MGACASSPEGCVRGSRRPPGLARKQWRRRRRVSSQKGGTMETIDEVVVAGLPYAAAAAEHQGSPEDAWFDAIAIMESDCDDDFLSVRDDSLSLNGFEDASASNLTSSKDTNQDGINLNTSSSIDQNQNGLKPGDHFVSHDDVYILSVDEASVREEEATLVNCGILPNNCLPFLAPTVPTIEKRRSLSSSPPNSKKKGAVKLSFKRRSGEGHPIPTLFSTKAFLERPLAGSQVPFCPLEKKMLDCWSRIEPSTFKVRGENYFRDKKKVFAPNYAAYYPFGVDVYLCQQKIDHIGRFVELPTVNSSGKFPPILVVNVQMAASHVRSSSHI